MATPLQAADMNGRDCKITCPPESVARNAWKHRKANTANKGKIHHKTRLFGTPLGLKGADGILSCGIDIKDPVHADKFESRPDLV